MPLLLVCLGGPADGHHEDVDVDHAPPAVILRAAGRYTQIPTDITLSMTVAGHWRTFRSERVKLYVYAGQL
ncbi:MAG: hypothetical protein ACQSGP_27675 [Frankia sp.]